MAKKVKAQSAYKLPNPLVYRLSNPNYTIYHRAALGGLAATIQAWDEEQPSGIKAEVERDQVHLSWDESLSDQDFLHRLIRVSFKRDEESKLIELPGQQIKRGIKDLRLAIHNGIAATFLQHNKMRPGEKTPRMMPLNDADGKELGVFSYKAVNEYAHQKAQGLGLFDVKEGGRLPATAAIPQWMVPGATGGAAALEAPTDEIILLMYLMVGCAMFLLRPRTFQEKTQACVIVPDIIDLVAFARAIKRTAALGQKFERFSNTYLGRIVGGAEEAALSFMLDLQAGDIVRERSVAGCIVVAMGKVSWDKNQINRSLIAKVRDDYEELAVFKAAKPLGRSKVIKTKDGVDYVVRSSALPELIAANLAAGNHWCANFKSLVSEKKDFEQMLFDRGGLKDMKEAIKDADDQAILRAFHEAWSRTRRNLGIRDEKRDADAGVSIQNRKEKMRNDILRAKTADALASWFLRFCADATKGNALDVLKNPEEARRVREFIFSQRNFERFQNLCLFALVSYSYTGKVKAGNTEGGEE
jgi:CRISPR-associated protein Cas8a1/Csx13